MPPEDQPGQPDPRWPQPLDSRLGADAGVAQVVDAILALWREIETVLSPIVGQRGVAALFNRSPKLVSVRYPWLAAGQGGALDAVDLPALKAALLRQPAAAAAAGGGALLQSFHDSLTSLIGASLTNRLLHSVWAPPEGATPAQDPSP